MSADQIRPEDEWPLPPAWMWACQECADRYRFMKRAIETVEELRLTGQPHVDHDPFDSIVSSQIALAEHMAAEHLDQLPEWSPTCATCASHRKAVSGAAGRDDSRAATLIRIGGEHRARHIVVPPSIVELY
ncbi:hypothetical protein [Streptomyces sp. JJ38]|uniref:hypothetical protein n=1 Tax=Streptomyces sp. JJ38 TaxID=2738128 RepID=UPI001C574583|nr:hypothetical protein [Streptomyces sp. JJ38]MBW1595602.1 hypothetical protein [Streptomyces sp. JJ38]